MNAKSQFTFKLIKYIAKKITEINTAMGWYLISETMSSPSLRVEPFSSFFL